VIFHPPVVGRQKSNEAVKIAFCPPQPVVFAGSRKFAKEWAYRFLGAAVADHTGSS